MTIGVEYVRALSLSLSLCLYVSLAVPISHFEISTIIGSSISLLHVWSTKRTWKLLDYRSVRRRD